MQAYLDPDPRRPRQSPRWLHAKRCYTLPEDVRNFPVPKGVLVMATICSARRSLIFICAALPFLLALAAAKDEHSPKATEVPAMVIAHLALPQPTGSQMLLQRQDTGKNYLYVQQASKQGFMIVDVTKPAQPSLLKRTAEQTKATSGNMQILTPDVAIAEAPEKKPNTLTSNAHPTETVRVLDLSDPRNPKTLQEFTGVTSLLPDGNHGLIYLANDQGLWVLRYYRPPLLEPSKKKPPCDSESQIMAMPPDCD